MICLYALLLMRVTTRTLNRIDYLAPGVHLEMGPDSFSGETDVNNV